MSDASITPIAGEPTRFLAASDKDAGISYLVDLASFDGNSQCDCTHFRTRLQPKLEAGERDWSEEQTLLCKHCKRAYLWFAREVVRGLDKNK